MFTAGQRVSLTNAGPGPNFFVERISGLQLEFVFSQRFFLFEVHDICLHRPHSITPGRTPAGNGKPLFPLHLLFAPNHQEDYG